MGKFVEDRGNIVEDMGKFVEDRGNFVGDMGKMIEDRGNIAEHMGKLIEDRGEIVEDMGKTPADHAATPGAGEEDQAPAGSACPAPGFGCVVGLLSAAAAGPRPGYFRSRPSA